MFLPSLGALRQEARSGKGHRPDGASGVNVAEAGNVALGHTLLCIIALMQRSLKPIAS
jgi:hypothetical protein